MPNSQPTQPTGQPAQPVVIEIVIENWDEIEPTDTYDANYWISDAMKAAVGRYFIKHGVGKASLSDVSLHIDHERGVVILTETPTETPAASAQAAAVAGEGKMDSDDENLAEHSEHVRSRTAQALGLLDPQAGPLVPPVQHGRPEGI